MMIIDVSNSEAVGMLNNSLSRAAYSSWSINMINSIHILLRTDKPLNDIG
jgi:hypothetical protein